MSEKKILIIDDDEELREEMAEMLQAEGYRIDSVSDGPAGVGLIRSRSYDVFLIDFKLENMTGLDLLREIRARDRGASVFLVSGRPGLEDLLEKEGLAGGVTGIIEKPFAPQVLLDKVAASLARQGE